MNIKFLPQVYSAQLLAYGRREYRIYYAEIEVAVVFLLKFYLLSEGEALYSREGELCRAAVERGADIVPYLEYREPVREDEILPVIFQSEGRRVFLYDDVQLFRQGAAHGDGAHIDIFAFDFFGDFTFADGICMRAELYAAVVDYLFRGAIRNARDVYLLYAAEAEKPHGEEDHRRDENEP